MMLFANKFAVLGPVISDICRVSGIPALSLGILHNNKVVHTASFGFADLNKRIPCDSDTSFVLGSLSKAMIAALVASLHDDGSITSWDQPIRTVLPEFNRTDIYGETTLADLLSHRTGLAPLDSLWMASDNVPFLPKSEAVRTLNGAPGEAPFRSGFIYNNFAYEILGQVIEKVCGAKLADVLRHRLFEPLGMSRTYYTGESRDNEAKPYAALEDASFAPISPALSGEDVLMGPAGGIRSSVNDLLTLYRAFMEAACRETSCVNDSEPSSQLKDPLSLIRQLWQRQMSWVSSSCRESSQPKNPLRLVRKLWQGQMPLPSSSLREHSYAFGWARAELPSVLSPGDSQPGELNPIVGAGAPSRLAMYHGGNIPGFSTYNALFPETGSAVVVLTNGLSLNDGVRWIGELLIETLFDNSRNARDYLAVATQATDQFLQRFRDINESLESGRTIDKPTRPLDDYVGRYHNAIGNFFIEIKFNTAGDGLVVAYMGRSADTFNLVPYQEDSFYWSLTYDETVKLARYPTMPAEYHVLKFGSDTEGSGITRLWWRHEPGLPEPAQIFRKTEEGLPERSAEKL